MHKEPSSRPRSCWFSHRQGCRGKPSAAVWLQKIYRLILYPGQCLFVRHGRLRQNERGLHDLLGRDEACPDVGHPTAPPQVRSRIPSFTLSVKLLTSVKLRGRQDLATEH
jgi:hypothetical protein